jgi:hypothetical protein
MKSQIKQGLIAGTFVGVGFFGGLYLGAKNADSIDDMRANGARWAAIGVVSGIVLSVLIIKIGKI